MITDVLKIALPTIVSFIFGIAITPLLNHYLYKYQAWKASPRDDKVSNPDISKAFCDIHDHDAEMSTPRLGGLVIWLSVTFTALLSFVLAGIFDIPFFEKLVFLSRSQTILPLFALIVGSLIGMGEDLIEIRGNQALFIHGVPGWLKILIVSVIGLVGALWFYIKLEVTTLNVPLGGEIELGWAFIIVFILVVLATFSGSVIDGIDGLAGGVLATSFAAMAIIAFAQNQIDIATLSMVITGGILAFLWFNVPPARYYMGETGILGLTITLAIFAFLTRTVLLLPLIALPLALTSASVIIQRVSRRFWNKRVFLVAPLHHHLQALGWSREKITMRFWIMGTMSAVVGVVVALIG